MRFLGSNTGTDVCRLHTKPDLDFDNGGAQRHPSRLDPSEVVFMALNTGFCRDIGVMAMMLEGARDPSKDEAEGEIR